MSAVATMPLRALTDEDFAAAIGRAGGVLVLFTAAWCKPCVRAEAEAAQLAGVVRLPVMTCDIDAAPMAAMQTRLTAVPALALFRDGGLAGIKIGLWPRETLRIWVRDVLKGAAA